MSNPSGRGGITLSCRGRMKSARSDPASQALPGRPQALRAFNEMRVNLSRHFLQFREWHISHPRTGLDRVFDDAVEAPVDEEDGAFTRLAIAAVGFARAEPETGDIAQPSADHALDRLGHD